MVRIVNLGQLQWVGDVARRIADAEIPKKVRNGQLHRTRRRGWPRLRWQDACVTLYARCLGL